MGSLGFKDLYKDMVLEVEGLILEVLWKLRVLLAALHSHSPKQEQRYFARKGLFMTQRARITKSVEPHRDALVTMPLKGACRCLEARGN